ncbi:MAG: insulinase family protein [Acidobacteria bacterium]|nr:insulinase family protein [Acidobacteriota bacterium]
MRRLATITASILLAGFVLAAEPAATDVPAGYISEVLPNGLQVSILPEPSNPVVATQVWYHVGAAHEEPRTRGFAHLFEHLMFGGTAQHPARDYPEHHRRFGGYENAYTSWDETVYISAIPPDGHAAVLALEADRMVNLRLDQQNLDNEQRIVTEELRVSTENDPFTRVGVAALKAVLGEHPYAITPAGTKEDIAAATLAHAREFYARYYRPQNAHVVIVGPVDGAATLERVRADFGALEPAGETPAEIPALVDWQLAERVELSEDLPPVEIAILGYALPPADSPERPALELMTQLLAGGQVDPFEEELVRRRNKAVEAATTFIDLRRGGALVFYSAALPYRREASAFRFMDETREVLARLEWLTEESLAAAKRKLVRRELNQAYFADERAGAIGRARWWQGDERLAFSRAAAIEAVSREDVAAAFRRYVVEREPARVYLKPLRVPLLVRLFGWVYPLVSR